eukprot:gnl/Hemi2/11835_TR4059_c0_g1_i1.p1 gnl/Hemi2/11835_TR4059_c0_g1~~gnl/Hemi2/11835_TR4059_c0_g1_i1.p1  ORF type:complete len:147 (+),score=26.11 gnl/Hemi2/11835_TR4059_c0_g1_i1:76-516(+)
MTQPFLVYDTPTTRPLAMLPAMVDTIRTADQCQVLVNEAATAAAIRATALNYPRGFQFAQSLGVFANDSTANITHFSDGTVTMDYNGGCKLLTGADTREFLWPAAREKLREELRRYQTGTEQSNMGGLQSPILQCRTNWSNAWECN